MFMEQCVLTYKKQISEDWNKRAMNESQIRKGIIIELLGHKNNTFSKMPERSAQCESVFQCFMFELSTMVCEHIKISTQDCFSFNEFFFANYFDIFTSDEKIVDFILEYMISDFWVLEDYEFKKTTFLEEFLNDYYNNEYIKKFVTYMVIYDKQTREYIEKIKNTFSRYLNIVRNCVLRNTVE